VDLSLLGGIVSKGLFMKERQGHPPPRIVETPAGMINAIGLQGIGVHRFVKEKLPVLRERGARTFVNVCGTTLEEYVEVCKVLSQAEGVAAIELNISCPNIKEGGIQFGCSLNGTYDVVSAVRKATHLPVIPKLTPNVTDVASFARASEDAAADDQQRDGRAERRGDPADCGPHGVGVLSAGEDSDYRDGRHHRRARRD
jgi:dihydroorotate dehydrogenase (NAD+) catalytic subunit